MLLFPTGRRTNRRQSRGSQGREDRSGKASMKSVWPTSGSALWEGFLQQGENNNNYYLLIAYHMSGTVWALTIIISLNLPGKDTIVVSKKKGRWKKKCRWGKVLLSRCTKRLNNLANVTGLIRTVPRVKPRLFSFRSPVHYIVFQKEEGNGKESPSQGQRTGKWVISGTCIWWPARGRLPSTQGCVQSSDQQGWDSPTPQCWHLDLAQWY